MGIVAGRRGWVYNGHQVHVLRVCRNIAPSTVAVAFMGYVDWLGGVRRLPRKHRRTPYSLLPGRGRRFDSLTLRRTGCMLTIN